MARVKLVSILTFSLVIPAKAGIQFLAFCSCFEV